MEESLLNWTKTSNRHLFSNIFQGRKGQVVKAILHQGIENKLKYMLKAKLNASLLLGRGG